MSRLRRRAFAAINHLSSNARRRGFYAVEKPNGRVFNAGRRLADKWTSECRWGVGGWGSGGGKRGCQIRCLHLRTIFIMRKKSLHLAASATGIMECNVQPWSQTEPRCAVQIFTHLYEGFHKLNILPCLQKRPFWSQFQQNCLVFNMLDALVLVLLLVVL